jgi:hypothetical protein
MARLAHNTAVLLMPGEYLLSADLTSGQSVFFHKRTGDSGAWRPVTVGGSVTTLTPTDSTARVAVGAGEYLRATCSPTDVVAVSAEINPAI